MMADLTRVTWEFAIAEAGDGAPGLLALLLHAGNPPDDDLRHAVASLIERRIPERKGARGVRPRFDEVQARQIRYYYNVLTTPDPDNPSEFPGYTPAKAKKMIAEAFHAERYTIRDVLERRGSYRKR